MVLQVIKNYKTFILERFVNDSLEIVLTGMERAESKGIFDKVFGKILNGPRGNIPNDCQVNKSSLNFISVGLDKDSMWILIDFNEFYGVDELKSSFIFDGPKNKIDWILQIL